MQGVAVTLREVAGSMLPHEPIHGFRDCARNDIDQVAPYKRDFRFSSFPRMRESSSVLKRMDTRFRGYDGKSQVSESPERINGSAVLQSRRIDGFFDGGLPELCCHCFSRLAWLSREAQAMARPFPCTRRVRFR